MSVLAEAISEALHNGKQVIVEHFDLVYPLLGFNANLLIGVGEQILIARPPSSAPNRTRSSRTFINPSTTA